MCPNCGSEDVVRFDRETDSCMNCNQSFPRAFNVWCCEECDGLKPMEQTEFQAHLINVHRIIETDGTRSMRMHLDGTDFYEWVWDWEIGGKKFTQHTRSLR
jgi:hypothetical protein